jgi:hypothetical protein
MKKFLLLFALIIWLPFSAQSGVLTIDTEPPELIKLKKQYNKDKEESLSLSQYKKIQQKYERDTMKALNSPTYRRQLNVINTAQIKELEKVEKKYQLKLEKLKRNALKRVNRKYKFLLENHSQKTKQSIQSQYIVNLKQLENKLIQSGDLAGALVVQTERKKAMQDSESTIREISGKKATAKQTKKIIPAKPALKTSQPQTIKKIRLPPASSPQVYFSTRKGFAGSGKTSKGNSYSFKINPTKNGAKLFFYAYGRKSNNSYGEVFLSTPGGGKYQVAHWSPKQLIKKSPLYDVSKAHDVKPITADISKYVKRLGTYTVQFLYRDGEEALIIYKVGIKTR